MTECPHFEPWAIEIMAEAGGCPFCPEAGGAK